MPAGNGTREQVSEGRYARQEMIFGTKKQEALGAATVVVVGAGGLGSPAATYLATAGIGRLVVIDCDTVSLSNLNRQFLHGDADIGTAKVESAARRLRALNGDIEVIPVAERITAENAATLLEGADAVVDALDNFAVRDVLNTAAVRKGIPLMHGAIAGCYGQATTVIPGVSACLRCIFPAHPPTETFPALGATAGVIGSIQAGEVIKYLTGTGTLLTDRLLLWNGADATCDLLPAPREPACPVCSHLYTTEDTSQ
ncbi:adenylyltransferase [Methanomicrobiaceae archaeon CYW5]|nr:adenylyltransferase [Methanovulcanius yangii]